MLPLKCFINLNQCFPCLDKSLLIWNDFFSPSTLQLTTLVNLLLEPIEINLKTYERLELGLHEALVNAVKHGNSNNNSTFLRVRRIITPNWYIWQIQDEGRGIPKNLRKGYLPDELDACSGRGLYIICKCFDDIRWNSRGNRIQLAIKRK